MIYLHDGHIRRLGLDWCRLTGVIEEVLRLKEQGECAHPLKPYLRFRDPSNRIIAMPAYVGGGIGVAGIKWIASFPGNGSRGLPRAHNTLVLNDPDTGEPLAFLNSGLLNAIRTAAVSGAMLRTYLAARQPGEVKLGVIGWGPIGRMHLRMCAELLGDRLQKVTLYDLKGIDPHTVPTELRGITELADDWRPLYRASDIIATCTVAADRYIDEPPPRGALLLHVSLRDYKPASVADMKAIIVDDWQEVCRENTDIEQLHLQYGLTESGVCTLADAVLRHALAAWPEDEPVFFSPMGLGIFDIAIAAYYREQALRKGEGVQLSTERG
ncbi:ornithine cyclodeaminase [Paenibacillus sp. UNCCL117]|uniref:2,3-diaminopropionate biosynthesis protein SbnB n=1 Tax=unclassified Paenibacillus TaxID=185978 RepID=UPI00088BA5FC|nr:MULTISPECIES: 2,3-diaminopropionate biosynthesis protein SbnB [unclassified Paenibacillus]SDE61812.1 ornithine cyclodeaminase [Paenibacillus sp. cl123]SFW69822.1 ornithine cyclodeaminase [Paenibacillus sp. UNCCL117]